jgi:hypothetical protein
MHLKSTHFGESRVYKDKMYSRGAKEQSDDIEFDEKTAGIIG